MENLTIRFAQREDMPLTLAFIKKLAIYEDLLDQVEASVELLEHYLFDCNHAEVIIGYIGEEAVGFALFFHNFSTFLGKPGLHIEDIYIEKSMRKKGIGKKMFQFLARIALERGCARMEWACLDWNVQAQNFYDGLGAQTLNQWRTNRLKRDEMIKLAEEEPR